MVLLAPSWRALQHLLKILQECASDVDMMCIVNKTVCMIFPPKDKQILLKQFFLV